MTNQRQQQWASVARVWWPIFWLMIAVSAISACKPQTKPVPPATVVITGCQYFPRLSASKRDTDETKEQVLAYVTVWDRVCGKKP